ncbi:hypothetical protein CkaCkLH20_09837 [Colletotrichum karsti]|uniref:BZIP domain-containing protein n=1 Tax=Colletotrichum karsti TaxID=1095194 RepID=A0A9P6HXH5_9PEZI|nr:uncharacterized protein CkaCkLH20_09837 [Colletotrichum karsti]KAF9872658.1 hypothetical protein CkaCkLH20_09837 [Colletotrichum karsti]
MAVSAVVRSFGQHPQRSREAKEGDTTQASPSTASRYSGFENGHSSKQPAPAPNPDPCLASSTDQGGQCPGPQGQERVGDQVSMSQRGPAPTSRPPSQSPPRAPFQQYPPPGRPQDVAAREPYPPRSLGIRGLINPSEAQSEGRPSETPQPRPIDPQSSPYGMPPRQYGTPGDRPFSFPGPLGSQPVTPAGHPATTPLGLTPSESSPKGGFPFPAMSRQALSPRETRAASVGQAAIKGPESQQTPFLPPAAPRAKRPYQADDAPHESVRPAPGLPFSGPPSLGPPSTMAPMTTPPRAMSQPMIGQVPPPDRPQLPPMPRDPRAPEYQVQQGMVPPGPGYSQQVSPPGPVWSAPGSGTALYQSLRSESAKAVMEGGIMFRIGGDSGMVVPVDVHQASKQADEKRQRNAGASARFRQRKKERDQEQIASMQKLEQRNRELESRMRDLAQERDFYRDERNRLREVVLRTPLSEMANGPPSPTSSRSGGSMAETSPMTQAPILPPHHQQQGYASSESSVERPTRRRRTDSAPTPEFSVPSYGTPVPQPGNLPPMQAGAYGMMQRPPSTTPGGERLPPLRAMEGPFGGPGPDLGGMVTTPGGPMYPSYTRVPHETGFASRPSGPSPPHGHHPHDQGQR